MSATYLLRFDDICPTLNWEVWDTIEGILHDAEVRPILAVVPDNQDPDLHAAAPRADFWDRIRRLQKRGWHIAMHGWQHRYVTANAGMLGVNRRSEFAGLPRADQSEKLRQGRALFLEQSVNTDLWVAPAHSFDEITVQCLADLGFRYISDGFPPFPFRDDLGMLWLPQQLWSFRRRPLGVWTICFHINRWTGRDIALFKTDIEAYRSRITDLEEVVRLYAARPQSTLHRAANKAFGRSYRFLAVAKSVTFQAVSDRAAS